MEPPPFSLQGDHDTLRVPRSGPFRIAGQSPGSEGAQEDPSRASGNHSPRAPLAPETLVLGLDLPICRSAVVYSGQPDCPRPGFPSPSGSGMVPLNRVEAERFLLQEAKVPSSVIDIILASRRPSTVRIYNSTWASFSSWCQRARVNPLSASILDVLLFLREGFAAGLSPNTLRRQAAAISTVLTCGSASSISRHPVVQQFLRGAANLRPPPVHRFPTWDLNKVLSALTASPFEPLRDVSLRFLSFKVSFLVAITSARRISELAALSSRRDLCVFHQDRVVLRLDPSFIPKINSPFHRSQELVLPNFCPSPQHPLERSWHTLDVRRALKIYLRRTSSFRKTEALFVSYQPASIGAKASAPMLGRWIRATISTAYQRQSLPVPHHVTAHSTRSAATSAAWATQASWEEICRAAAWSSISPFIRHYRVDSFASADAAFGRRVLQTVHST
ncbi:uncharacterized protein LOC117674907 [Pantherophis guttatus]|uniref:Uncharacterized protein LOC117664749 n=1 Tax=Pantherophis guttatus TaxID=94885 RepID=A0A6P9D006_PANGU|nr:uncharacterized protein LOC117664749 isoform X2 [Pantherophis guttatus]XP_034285342.1 uncharacterized protein LOC117672640 [Pantherophis guttatus]XP_034289029.1 uncharacterized protein LOC117674907 [Pantherophis guttatus]